jgi:hypothetical protein
VKLGLAREGAQYSGRCHGGRAQPFPVFCCGAGGSVGVPRAGQKPPRKGPWKEMASSGLLQVQETSNVTRRPSDHRFYFRARCHSVPGNSGFEQRNRKRPKSGHSSGWPRVSLIYEVRIEPISRGANRKPTRGTASSVPTGQVFTGSQQGWFLASQSIPTLSEQSTHFSRGHPGSNHILTCTPEFCRG